MSFERRLSKLETSVSPTEAVLSWLAEAHEFPIVPESFGSLLDGSLLDAPKEAWPLVRIGGQVEASVRAAMKGKTADAVWKAVRRRVGDAFFLFELVIRLNLAAEEILRFEGLRWSTLTLLMRDLSHDTDFGAPPPEQAKRSSTAEHHEVDWQTWREAASGLLTGVHVEEEARASLERRHLDGRPVLFPELAEGWGRLRGQAEGLALVARRLPSPSSPAQLNLDEAAVREGLRNDAAASAPARTSELVDLARAITLDALGETERVGAIIEQKRRSTPFGGDGAHHLAE